ncbi:MAG TPA: cytochrome P450 [Pseudonocardia sp.]|jgi:cytochrome P450
MAVHVNLADYALFADGPPHEVFDKLRADQPVHWSTTDERSSRGGGFWSLTRYNDIAEVSRDNRMFCSAQGISLPNLPGFAESQRDMLIFTDPPEHARLRKLLSRSFTPRVVERFETWIREVTAEVIDRAVGRAEFDFVAEISRQIPPWVLARAIGVPEDMSQQIVTWANDVFDHASVGNFAGYFETATKIHEYVLELREQKRRVPTVDLTSELALAESRGHLLSDAEYVNYMQLLLTAGVETTQTLMSNLMAMVLADEQIERDVVAAVRAGDARAVTEEFLRMITPAMHFCRTATEDTEVGGQRIRAGEYVAMWFVAGNRDPEVFVDPHRFDPYRFDPHRFSGSVRQPGPMLSFGAAGGHYCMGSHLARIEGQVFIEEMFTRGRRWALAGDVARRPSVFVNTIASIPVTHG